MIRLRVSALALMMTLPGCAQPQTLPETTTFDRVTTNDATGTTVLTADDLLAVMILKSDEVQVALPSIVAVFRHRGLTEADVREAVVYAYREYLYHSTSEAHAAQAAAAGPHAVEIRPDRLARDTPKRCKLVVKSTPPGAGIFIDAQQLGYTPRNVWPMSGSTVRVRLPKPGYVEKIVERSAVHPVPDIDETLDPIPPKAPASKPSR